MNDLPEPPTEPGIDLRGMPYMPLDVVRLFDSDFYALSTGDEFKAGLSLWCKAFLQAPAGSLPTDDRLLAHLSGAGVRWKAVRSRALHGWYLCQDGRLYHPVVAEKVADAWKSRCDRRTRTEAARAARQATRGSNHSVSGSNTPPVVTTSVTENVTTSVTDNVTTLVAGSKGTEQNGREGNKKEREERTPNPLRVLVASDDDPGFAEFWASYPRKDDKGHARKAWAKAIGKADVAAIVAGTRGYRFNENPRFIPLPATWLNGERWLQATDCADDMDPVLKAAGCTQADLDQWLNPTTNSPQAKRLLQ